MPGVGGSFAKDVETKFPAGPRIEAGEPPSIGQKLKDFFSLDWKEQRAKAANAMAYSEAFNVSPDMAYRYHDTISEFLCSADDPALSLSPLCIA